MKKGLARVAFAITLFAAATPGARAEPLDANLSLTLSALSGQHEIDGGHSTKLSFVPLPLGELTLRRGRDSIRLEGLPPVSFRYGSTLEGATTRLSILNATLRHGFPGGWFVGVGQTVYNQFTTYAPVQGSFVYQRNFTIEPINGSEAQYSRVTGARLEAGRSFDLGREHVEYSVSVNPRMRGIQFTRIPTFITDCIYPPRDPVAPGPRPTPISCSQRIDTFSDPENASQVDFSLRIAHRLSKRGALLYGLRYLNYTAHYDDFPGQLADRNVGFAPVLGYRLKL